MTVPSTAPRALVRLGGGLGLERPLLVEVGQNEDEEHDEGGDRGPRGAQVEGAHLPQPHLRELRGGVEEGGACVRVLLSRIYAAGAATE